MKETLRGRLNKMLDRLNSRIIRLEKYVEEYKEVEDFENAMKCDIKRRTLLLVHEELDKELKYYY